MGDVYGKLPLGDDVFKSMPSLEDAIQNHVSSGTKHSDRCGILNVFINKVI